MAGELTTTITFADGDQVTSEKLNDIISGASFTSSAVTGTTLSVVGGKLKVGTVTESEIGSNSISTAALQTLSVTSAKIALGAVGTLQIANLGVGTNNLGPAVVTFDKISGSAFAGKTQMENESDNFIASAIRVKNSPGVAKAYGRVTVQATGRVVTGGQDYNVSGATRNTSTGTIVTLTNNMGSANYTVIAHCETDGSGTGEVSVYSRSAGSFSLKHTVETDITAIHFVVFGNL